VYKLLKDIINSALSLVNLQISSRGSIARSQKDAYQHIKKLDFKPNTIFDVGVGKGTFDLYNSFPESKIFLIEPLEEFKDSINIILGKYDAEWIKAAACETSGEIAINVHTYRLESSSILSENDNKHSMGVDGESRSVRSTALDDLIDKKIKPPILMKIDVQGAELNVLKGASKLLEETDYLLLELQLFDFFMEGSDFYEIIDYLYGYGFTLYDICGGYTRPYDGALASIDAAFVKEKGPFRIEHYFASKAQRTQQLER
jgi:FkbM family methyltransferase